MGEKVFLAKNSRAQCFIFLTAGICTFLVSLLCIFFVSLWIGVAVSILGGILLGFFIYFYRQPRIAIEIESECLKLYKRNQEWSFSLKSIEKIIILDQGCSLDFTVHLNDFSKFGFHFLIENSEKTKREWIRCLEECGVKVIMETSPV